MPAKDTAATIQTLPAAKNYANPESFVPSILAPKKASGGGFMPAPVIAAGIGAAGQVIGGLLDSRGQSKAADAGLTASREAIAFQKQQQLEERRRLAAMWDSWYNRRRSLMNMYGLDVPEAQNPFMDATIETYGGTGAPQKGTSLADLVNRGKPVGGNPDRWME